MEYFWFVLEFPVAIHDVGGGGVRASGPKTSSDSGFPQFPVEALGCF